METIYYDYTPNYGVNACVCGEWDFYDSMDELMQFCIVSLSVYVIFVPVSAPSSSFVGYRDGIQ